MFAVNEEHSKWLPGTLLIFITSATFNGGLFLSSFVCLLAR